MLTYDLIRFLLGPISITVWIWLIFLGAVYFFSAMLFSSVPTVTIYGVIINVPAAVITGIAMYFTHHVIIDDQWK